MIAIGKLYSVAVYNLACIKELIRDYYWSLARDIFRREIRGKDREDKNYTYELFLEGCLNGIGLVVYLFF